MAQMTPMMAQYCKTKEEYKDCILLYRLGDFYEMFFDDAITVSRELELTLTGKDCGLEERAPMCGVPYHAVEGYLTRLVAKGYKVAICEQMEDPALAKGLVKREVVRIVTPGTIMEAQSLDSAKNNYIVCIVCMDDHFGIAAADISTGDFSATEVTDRTALSDELFRYAPKEILCNEALLLDTDTEVWKKTFDALISPLKPSHFDEKECTRILKEHFHTATTEGLGLTGMSCAVSASGALLAYLEETQKNTLSHLFQLRVYHTDRHMILDNFTRRNLELTETMRDKQKIGSLLWVLDKTKTAMGARLLRSCILQPLITVKEITDRQRAVGELKEDAAERQELREYLSAIYDMERLMGRLSYGTGTPRDLIAFRDSIAMLVPIRAVLSGTKTPLLRDLCEQIDPLEDLHERIAESITDDPPLAMKDGNIIREGYHEEVDRLRMAKQNGKEWLAKLEEDERERTGIKNLRIRYNKVFGYYIEVTNAYKDKVPKDYIRKQTLTNAERYFVPKLKELEDTILGAEDRLRTLEYELFSEVRAEVAANVKRIKKSAGAIAQIDMLASLSEAAARNHYTCPEVNLSGRIKIKDGRHPVIEAMRKDELFVPNDTVLDTDEQRIAIITGPNMAGKSTYMRQSALIVLMAQIGSFVPAEEAQIGIVDRIFTRVGASDDLASGQSTFMVEMTEVASILRNATSKSLLILDEIGRGTSTFDGLSIAWAVIEYISDQKRLGARTLFATHYHELTELEGKIPGVKNYCIAVREQGDDIVFLRKIIRGGADQSYGIQVAHLAGLPDPIIRRAKEIVSTLSDTDITSDMKTLFTPKKEKKKPKKAGTVFDQNQYTLFEKADDSIVLDEIRNMDLTRMTPLEALGALDRLQKKLTNPL